MRKLDKGLKTISDLVMLREQTKWKKEILDICKQLMREGDHRKVLFSKAKFKAMFNRSFNLTNIL